MGPISTGHALRSEVFSAIEKQQLDNQVSFSLTAFRDSTEEVPELDYLTRRLSAWMTVLISISFSKALIP